MTNGEPIRNNNALSPGKKKIWFWSVDFLTFVRWQGRRLFFESQPKFSKSNEYQHADMDADAEVVTSCVRCWMSGVGSRLAAFQAWRKRGVGGWRGHIGRFRSHFLN